MTFQAITHPGFDKLSMRFLFADPAAIRTLILSLSKDEAQTRYLAGARA
tara:strand:+ start:592 stop:738 length:147 start_codon:yes stop_codon:yes gene_type:complete